MCTINIYWTPCIDFCSNSLKQCECRIAGYVLWIGIFIAPIFCILYGKWDISIICGSCIYISLWCFTRCAHLSSKNINNVVYLSSILKWSSNIWIKIWIPISIMIRINNRHWGRWTTTITILSIIVLCKLIITRSFTCTIGIVWMKWSRYKCIRSSWIRICICCIHIKYFHSKLWWIEDSIFLFEFLDYFCKFFGLMHSYCCFSLYGKNLAKIFLIILMERISSYSIIWWFNRKYILGYSIVTPLREWSKIIHFSLFFIWLKYLCRSYPSGRCHRNSYIISININNYKSTKFCVITSYLKFNIWWTLFINSVVKNSVITYPRIITIPIFFPKRVLNILIGNIFCFFYFNLFCCPTQNRGIKKENTHNQ